MVDCHPSIRPTAVEDLMQIDSSRLPVAIAEGHPASTAAKTRGARRAWDPISLSLIWLAMTPAFGQSPAPSGAGGPLGRWATHTGNLEVEIAPCGPALCGTVTKVLGNRSMSSSGQMAPADNRTPLGMVILKDFASSGDDAWYGELYSREEARTYSCKITLGGPDQLIVHPYVGLTIFGKTFIWKRVAAPQTGQK
jgi:uncharacterized protein (DUF2147 family)